MVMIIYHVNGCMERKHFCHRRWLMGEVGGPLAHKAFLCAVSAGAGHMTLSKGNNSPGFRQGSVPVLQGSGSFKCKSSDRWATQPVPIPAQMKCQNAETSYADSFTIKPGRFPCRDMDIGFRFTSRNAKANRPPVKRQQTRSGNVSPQFHSTSASTQ